MITYKNTNDYLSLARTDGFRQRINSNAKTRKTKVDRGQAQVDQVEFETMVLEQINTLQQKAVISKNVALFDFFNSLRNKLTEKNPNLDDIINLIENTKV